MGFIVFEEEAFNYLDAQLENFVKRMDRIRERSEDCLCLGGAGLVSLYLLNNTGMMVFSMIGIGIAWASILAMPYAILSDSLPADKMGTYMGIFNFFITIPQITNGIIHGWIVRNVYHGHAVFALLTGGVFLFFDAAAVSLVKEKKFSRKV